jgi:hypothetical protein
MTRTLCTARDLPVAAQGSALHDATCGRLCLVLRLMMRIGSSSDHLLCRLDRVGPKLAAVP